MIWPPPVDYPADLSFSIKSLQVVRIMAKGKSKFKCKEHGQMSPAWIRIFPHRATPKDLRPFCAYCMSTKSDQDLVEALLEFYPTAEPYDVIVAVEDMRRKFSKVSISNENLAHDSK